jgi:hypothetical protein
MNNLPLTPRLVSDQETLPTTELFRDQEIQEQQEATQNAILKQIPGIEQTLAIYRSYYQWLAQIGNPENVPVTLLPGLTVRTESYTAGDWDNKWNEWDHSYGVRETTIVLNNPLPGQSRVTVEFDGKVVINRPLAQAEVLAVGFHDDDGLNRDEPAVRDGLIYTRSLEKLRVRITDAAGTEYEASISSENSGEYRETLKPVQNKETR